LPNADAGMSHEFASLEGNLARPESFEVVARLGGGTTGTELNLIPGQFDPSLSYGQTRAAFDSELESHYVSWLLARHHGNISAAAREARMDRKHLHDLAKKHGLRGPKITARR
jgi:DNA-binding NtrC family response regulator